MISELESERIIQLNLPTGRVYETPSGNRYPSVTRIVDVINRKSIQEWETRVGKEEADKIRNAATTNGTNFHLLMENTLKFGVQKLKFGEPNFAVYPKLCKFVVPKISNIRGVELPLYSDEIECAGTCDLIADWEGHTSIIDWKTSRHEKHPEKVISYWLQTAAYAIMMRERYEIEIEKLVLVINVDGREIQVFEQSPQHWMKSFRNLRIAYKKKFGI